MTTKALPQRKTLGPAICDCIAIKEGNKEFALFYFGTEWRAEIGNDCRCVTLGEVSGEFEGNGATAIEAVNDLIGKLRIAALNQTP